MPTSNADPEPFLCSQEQYAALMDCSVSGEHVFQVKARAWFKREEDGRNRVIRGVFLRLRPVPYPPLPTA